MKAIVYTFKTATTVFHVVNNKVTLARDVKTGRFVKLEKVKKIFSNLLTLAKKYNAVANATKFDTPNKGAFIATKNMFENALKFFRFDSHMLKGLNYKMITKDMLLVLANNY